MNDTSPEVNAVYHARMMALPPGRRLEMAFSMLTTSRQIILSTLPEGLPTSEKRRLLYERLYGEPCPVPRLS